MHGFLLIKSTNAKVLGNSIITFFGSQSYYVKELEEGGDKRSGSQKFRIQGFEGLRIQGGHYGAGKVAVEVLKLKFVLCSPVA